MTTGLKFWEQIPQKKPIQLILTEGKKKGSSTWRCKECHGWDYRGKDGAYSKGSHFTGIKGVRSMENVSTEKIATIIRNKTHAYSEEMISKDAVEKLSLFLSQGQIDMDKYIDGKTKKARGDAKRGGRFYMTLCAVCHGTDGRCRARTLASEDTVEK